MRTKAQLSTLIADKLLRQLERGANFNDLVAAVQAKSLSDRNMLVRLLVENKTTRVGELLRDALKVHMREIATTQAESALSNNTLSLTELDRII